MQINFKTLDHEPQAHRFIVHRDSAGSYELIDKLGSEDMAESQVSGGGGEVCVGGGGGRGRRSRGRIFMYVVIELV